MSKNIPRWFWYLLAVSAFCIVALILCPSTLFPRTFRIVCTYICVYMVVDSLALIALLSILRKFDMIASKKFISYLAVVVVGSLFISFLLFTAYKPLVGKTCVESANLLFYILIEFTPLAIFNVAFSKIIFAVRVRHACLIGILMGLINALIGIPPLCG